VERNPHLWNLHAGIQYQPVQTVASIFSPSGTIGEGEGDTTGVGVGFGILDVSLGSTPVKST